MTVTTIKERLEARKPSRAEVDREVFDLSFQIDVIEMKVAGLRNSLMIGVSPAGLSKTAEELIERGVSDFEGKLPLLRAEKDARLEYLYDNYNNSQEAEKPVVTE